jgi:AraC family ethanolamine operon transcriptional activator
LNSFANNWGFWHMDRFAADYRRQFGELPSETRRHTLRTTR